MYNVYILFITHKFLELERLYNREIHLQGWTEERKKLRARAQ